MKKFLFVLMGLVVAGNAFGDDGCSCVYYPEYSQEESWPYVAIHFETDQYAVCDCAKAEVAEFLKSLEDVKLVDLIGMTDATGSDTYNKVLSGQRVNVVTNFLREILPGLEIVATNAGEAEAYYRNISGANDVYRSVLIIPVQKHVSEICEQTKIQEIIQKFPKKTVELKDACNNKNLSNDKVIEILEKLADQNPEIKEIVQDSGVYKLYAELLTETEDIRRRVSVWRTAEGKFNTARLASDSIAGVVLGTVGGVVTSNLIKKNQVKQGFEDIKCAIGGQTVASYGDEFRVGLQ